MRYSITFTEDDHIKLTNHLFEHPSVEAAAYILCRTSISDDELRLLVTDIIPVEKVDVTEASSIHMKIKPLSFLRAMKEADRSSKCFVFVHSHPKSYPVHSRKDDEEENKLFTTAYVRIRTPGVHASIVFSQPESPMGRVWLPDGSTQPIELIRIIGRRFRFRFNVFQVATIPDFFDRQVRAFGTDIQHLLHKLHIGIVGAGGTGSCVAEQLIRLGVGKITVADDDVMEKSNVNRVYGSRSIDDGVLKVKIVERLAADIGSGTKVALIPKSISFLSAIKSFKECDVIFGCTDDEWGRSILTRFSVYYIIPVIDMGVKIDSDKGVIKSLQGRVTVLMPSTSCLFCRGRIHPENIRIESLQATDPEAANALVREGYAPELKEPAPAVIPFTTTIASSAVSEFLHRLTGFMGEERNSSEILHLIDDSRIRTNSNKPINDCFCINNYFWGRGDTDPFLDITWRNE